MEIPNKYKIDLSCWKRKEHYNFFRSFEQPFFGVTSAINCTEAYNYCKVYNVSFLLYYLHKSLLAVNQVKEFRYRIEQEDVIEYSHISGSITVLRNDETFGFAYFDHRQDFKTFAVNTKAMIDAEKMASGLTLRNNFNSLIHYSILPGINFSAMQHAQLLSSGDSVPKIVFGKVSFKNGEVLLPVSVHVNHALCDGLHVSNFFDIYQRQMQIT
jgi:chloramphenicol O-acetyltransferase type A